MEKERLRLLGKSIITGLAILIAGAYIVLSSLRLFQEMLQLPITPFFLYGGSVRGAGLSLLLGVLMGTLVILLTRSTRAALYRLTHDNVTGLPWRTEIPVLAPKGCTAYVYIILRDYESYIERYSSSVSDPFMAAAAKAIKDSLVDYPCDIYRFSDSDFLLTCKANKTVEDLIAWFWVVTEVLEVKSYDISLTDRLHKYFNLSIGVAPTTHSTDSEVLITYAKFAAMEANGTGEPCVMLFDFKAYMRYRSVIERRNHLPELIENAQLSTVFQPIVSCKTGELYGYEALTRPTNPAYSYVGDMLDDAEVLGIYPKLEFLMTMTAITTFRRLGQPNARLFINMAPETIKKRIYDDPIRQGQLDNIKFVIEIIERGDVFADVISILNKSITNLNAMIALDDFGTGYSNHLALLNSKPDIVKVAHELIRGIDKDSDKQQVYENTVSFARGLGTMVLAEGVENKEEFEYLLRLGMDLVQGYYVGKPSPEFQLVPAEVKKLIIGYQEFAKVLEEHQVSRFNPRS